MGKRFVIPGYNMHVLVKDVLSSSGHVMYYQAVTGFRAEV